MVFLFDEVRVARVDPCGGSAVAAADSVAVASRAGGADRVSHVVRGWPSVPDVSYREPEERWRDGPPATLGRDTQGNHLCDREADRAMEAR
jgi:hypothetical protein